MTIFAILTTIAFFFDAIPKGVLHLIFLNRFVWNDFARIYSVKWGAFVDRHVKFGMRVFPHE
jgi:hypothetical protein